MKSRYEDILALTDKEPLWYDQNGVPRFAKFHPDLCPSIYTSDVFLLLIGCQACGQKFQVEMHLGLYGQREHPKHLHYGDPPIHDCVGDTMNCDDIQVLEAWHRDVFTPWHRKPELEVYMEDRWIYGDEDVADTT